MAILVADEMASFPHSTPPPGLLRPVATRARYHHTTAGRPILGFLGTTSPCQHRPRQKRTHLQTGVQLSRLCPVAGSRAKGGPVRLRDHPRVGNGIHHSHSNYDTSGVLESYPAGGAWDWRPLETWIADQWWPRSSRLGQESGCGPHRVPGEPGSCSSPAKEGNRLPAQ